MSKRKTIELNFSNILAGCMATEQEAFVAFAGGAFAGKVISIGAATFMIEVEVDRMTCRYTVPYELIDYIGTKQPPTEAQKAAQKEYEESQASLERLKEQLKERFRSGWGAGGSA